MDFHPPEQCPPEMIRPKNATHELAYATGGLHHSTDLPAHLEAGVSVLNCQGRNRFVDHRVDIPGNHVTAVHIDLTLLNLKGSQASSYTQRYDEVSCRHYLHPVSLLMDDRSRAEAKPSKS